MRIWTIPGAVAKGRLIIRVPLADAVVELLKQRKANAASIFVLPSDLGKTGHYTTPTKAWKTLLKRANLDNVTIHDLRRTTGSVMAGHGTSLPIIGKVLGHKHQSTTAIYARLSIDPLRDAMEQATRTMLSSQDAPDKVVPIRRAVNSGKK